MSGSTGEHAAIEPHIAHKRQLLGRVRRVVLKVGSSILSSGDGIRRERVAEMVEEIAALHDRGLEVMVVSSGAVAAGVARLGMKERPKTVPQRQAAAAVGQIHLMALYEELFARRGIAVAQILLTHDDLANRRRYLNARLTLETLFDSKVLPVANENDTVVTAELTTFGDNDNLSALIAGLVEADLLVLLSDVPGLYTKNPSLHPDAELVPLVDESSRSGAGIRMEGSSSSVGTGGMGSKFSAALKASAAGIPTIIADGRRSGVLPGIFDLGQSVGTLFLPRGDRLARRKHWIAYTLKPTGSLVVDHGAAEALAGKGRSLLPSGVRAVEGRFDGGACVRCVDPDGREFARGLVSYSAAELEKIKGEHSSKIEALLGYKRTDEVIHRNDLVLL